MHNTVHKKNDELLLWEVDAPARKKGQKSGRKKQVTQGTISVIPTDGRGEKAGSARAPGNAGTNGNARARTSGSGRTADRTRQTGNARAAGSSRAIQVVAPGRPRQQASPQAIKRRKARRRRAYFYRALAFFMIGVCVALLGVIAGLLYKTIHTMGQQETYQPVEKKTILFGDKKETGIPAPDISAAYLDINEYSRPGTPLNKVNSIFVHYTANPGTSALQNRSYFANLAETHERSASAHFIIGYEGEIVQCMPLEEQAYAVMTRNEDSISVECCYVDEDGKFTQETYDSLVHLLAWLTEKYNLSSEDILRHYDCGGKLCPLYYVDHEDLWAQLLADVDAYKESGKEGQ